MDFLKSIVEELKDENTNIMADGKGAAEFAGFIDTGSYLLNAAFSGSLFGGIADNKVFGLAGESSTGKCARGTEIIQVYMAKETKEKLRL